MIADYILIYDCLWFMNNEFTIPWLLNNHWNSILIFPQIHSLQPSSTNNTWSGFKSLNPPISHQICHVSFGVAFFGPSSGVMEHCWRPTFPQQGPFSTRLVIGYNLGHKTGAKLLLFFSRKPLAPDSRLKPLGKSSEQATASISPTRFPILSWSLCLSLSLSLSLYFSLIYLSDSDSFEKTVSKSCVFPLLVAHWLTNSRSSPF